MSVCRLLQVPLPPGVRSPGSRECPHSVPGTQVPWRRGHRFVCVRSGPVAHAGAGEKGEAFPPRPGSTPARPGDRGRCVRGQRDRWPRCDPERCARTSGAGEAAAPRSHPAKARADVGKPPGAPRCSSRSRGREPQPPPGLASRSRPSPEFVAHLVWRPGRPGAGSPDSVRLRARRHHGGARGNPKTRRPPAPRISGLEPLV